MTALIIESTRRIRHTTVMRDDWHCHLCNVSGRGGVKGFYRHYMQAHS